MNLSFYIPHKLDGIVSMIWEQRSEVSQRWKILPSGYIELLFNLGEKMKTLSGKNVSNSINPTENFCFLSGLHTQPLYMSYNQFNVMGVQLYPVAAKVLFKIPCCEIKDGALQGDLILDGMDCIENTIRSLPDFQSRAKWLETFLYSTIYDDFEFNMAVKISKLLKQLTAKRKIGEAIKIEDYTGYSRMHTYRLFNEWFGLSPSQCISLNLFTSAFKTMHAKNFTHTRIALSEGFYDQSHYIRIFRQFAHMTPGQYFRAKSDIPGQLPY